MGKTLEESLPKNPQEAARLPEPGLQINHVIVLETGNGLDFDTPPRSTRQPVDDPRLR